MPEPNSRLWDFFLGLFICSVFIFGESRVKYDMRWSAWAMGDAQCLNAGLHFANEGFRTHYFLQYYHPGYLGEHYGSESKIGYYTRYPPFSAILAGFEIKYRQEIIGVLSSFAWLSAFYDPFFMKRLPVVGILFMPLSV